VERLDGKQDLQVMLEHLRNSQGQGQTGAVFATFQVADGLVVHPNGISKFLS
jgi:hypothetical protein